MKIQLDTTSKTIKIEEKVNLGEMVKILDKLLPNKEWKQYELETNTVINNWGNTIYYKEYPNGWMPWYQSTPPYQVYCGTTLTSISDDSTVITTSNKSLLLDNKQYNTQGIYNIEVEA